MAIKVRLHMVNLLPPQSSPSFTSATSPYPVFVKITPIKLLSPQSSFFFSSSHLPSRGRADPSLLPEELIHWSPRHRSSRPGTPSPPQPLHTDTPSSKALALPALSNYPPRRGPTWDLGYIVFPCLAPPSAVTSKLGMST